MHRKPDVILRNLHGTEAFLACEGASLMGLPLPGDGGQFVNVALTPQGPCDPSCAGATLAPYAGRLRGGLLRIGARTLRLAVNEGPNQLHGGPNSLVHRPWRTQGVTRGDGWSEAAFEAELDDGVDGYPGRRLFRTVYRLWDDDRLDITLEARSDRLTVVNLSHHAYWNLSGDFSRPADDQLIRVNACAVYLNGEGHLPVGVAACGQPPFDVAQLRPVMRAEEAGDPQLALANGYNHAFRLRAGEDPAAELLDPVSGRRLRLYTDQPCLVVYAGGYLTPARCAVALEPQEHPRLAPDAPGPVLEPGSVYRRHIRYAFDRLTPPT